MAKTNNNVQSTSSNEYHKGGNLLNDVKKSNFKNSNAPTNKKPNGNFKNNKNTAPKKARPYVQPTEMKAGRDYEYKMSPAMYAELVKMCKKENGGDVQAYACRYVTEQFGLLGNCVSVIVG